MLGSYLYENPKTVVKKYKIKYNWEKYILPLAKKDKKVWFAILFLYIKNIFPLSNYKNKSPVCKLAIIFET